MAIRSERILDVQDALNRARLALAGLQFEYDSRGINNALDRVEEALSWVSKISLAAKRVKHVSPVSALTPGEQAWEADGGTAAPLDPNRDNSL